MVNNNLHSFTLPLGGTDMSPTANWDMTFQARDIFQWQQSRLQIFYLYFHSSIYTEDENTQATKQKNPSDSSNTGAELKVELQQVG